MKKTIILFIVILFSFASCERAFDRNFEVGPEKFYPPKVINTKGFSGNKRVKVTWDFSVNNINTAQKVFLVISAPVINYKDTVILDELVNSYIFENLQVDLNYRITVQTMDSGGNLSIIEPAGGQTVDVYVYGEYFPSLVNVAPYIFKGAGFCIVNFINNDESILKADISYDDINLSGRGIYKIDVPFDGSSVEVNYSDYKFYKSPGGVIGIDAIKVPEVDVVSIYSHHLLTDTISFQDKLFETIVGKVTYSEWQNTITELTVKGAFKSFDDLFLCRKLHTLKLDTLGGESVTTPDASSINFLIKEGILKKIIMPDEEVYDNIKERIMDQSIIESL